MVYNLISGKIIISTIYDEYNVQSRDWENRAPAWIAKALGYLGITYGLEEDVEEIHFDNYSFELPCNTKMLRAIVIDGFKLDRVTSAAFKQVGEVDSSHMQVHNKYILNAGRVELQIKSGTAYVIYRKLPLDWDDNIGMWIPRVPDIPEVIDNITWYVLKIILARGYSHPVYSLNTNREHNNPDLRWKNSMKAAKIKARSLDNEGRRIMAETLSTFLSDPNADINKLFFPEPDGHILPPRNWKEYIEQKIAPKKVVVGDRAKWEQVDW